jgi:two-component system, cell cycle sensor histidine kinase and response regulator CckA
MNHRKKHSISRNLTISLVTAIIVISLAFIALSYYLISEREKVTLKNKADENIDTIARTLKAPLWDMDRENISSICSYYYKDELITMVKLIGVSGEILYEKEKKVEVKKSYLVKRSRDIIYNDELIGNIQIGMTPKRSQEFNRQLLIASVLGLFITVSGLLFSTGFLLKIFLKKPMAYLGRIVDSYSKGDYSPPLQDVKYLEFEPLVSVFFDMGEKIESQMAELRRAEEILKEHRDQLEKMVAQRTKELETTNKSLKEEIKERERTEVALKESEERLRIAGKVAYDLIYEWDVESDSLEWFADIDGLLGYSKGKISRNISAWLDLIHPEDKVKLENAVEIHRTSKAPIRYEYRIKNRDGNYRRWNDQALPILDRKGFPYKWIGVCTDITEQRKAEEALKKSEEILIRAKKMESLGLLAGGVAHDLNNVLSGIVSYPELILMDLPQDSKLRKPIETMQESGHRAAAIVQDLLTVARGVATTKEPLNLNSLIGEYLFSPEFKKLQYFHPDILVKTNLDEDLLNISGSQVHITKVIMNLVSNASEAITGKGTVRISTVNRYIDRPLRRYDDVNIGEYAVMAVSDDGSGISLADLERIFEPFYSKKVIGRSGTGVGLSVVWNVVQDHKGYVDVKSDESGTTFILYFPITRDEISDTVLTIPIEDYKAKGETILVVDDVKSQRDISCKMLDKLGYKANAVTSGEAAVEYLKENSVDLILLDMIMDPGINGRETYERILKIHPKQKAIIVSGFAETDEVKKVQNMGAGQYIKKPFTLEKIGMAIKAELGK